MVSSVRVRRTRLGLGNVLGFVLKKWMVCFTTKVQKNNVKRKCKNESKNGGKWVPMLRPYVSLWKVVLRAAHEGVMVLNESERIMFNVIWHSQFVLGEIAVESP